MKEKILAIIPARGGSKGIPKKNIKELLGEPLISYTIKDALNSKYIDRIIVSTDDSEISDTSKKYDVEVIKRPEKISKDDSPTIDAIKHVLEILKETEKYFPDIIIVLQPTTPLRESEDIDRCIEKIIKEKCDSVITVSKLVHLPHWALTIDKDGVTHRLFNIDPPSRRQDADDIYMHNGAVYAVRPEIIYKYNTLRGPITKAIIVSDERSVNIDTEMEFFLAEKLMEEKKQRK